MNYVEGNNVEAYCPKCQVILAHTISKVAGARLSRVECDTCKDQHAYRKSHPKPSGAFSDAQKAATARRQVTKAATAFAAVMQQVDASTAVPYSFAARFEQDDVIEHQAFGLGRVMRLLAGDKMEVVFKGSSKILKHGVGSLAS